MDADHRTACDALLAAIRGRRSLRRFAPDPVPAEDIDRLLEASRWAPSPTNRQPWRFAVVRDPEQRRRLRLAVEEAAGRAALRLPDDAARQFADGYGALFTRFADAPAVVVVFARRPSAVAERLGAELTPGERVCFGGDLPAVGAAIQNLLLAAHALGYGACWMAGPLVAAPRIRAELGVPDTLDLAAVVAVGRPAETPDAPPRKPLSQLRVGRPAPGEP